MTINNTISHNNPWGSQSGLRFSGRVALSSTVSPEPVQHSITSVSRPLKTTSSEPLNVARTPRTMQTVENARELLPETIQCVATMVELSGMKEGEQI